MKSRHIDDLLSCHVNCVLHWTHPRNVELLGNPSYRAVIEKYGKV